MCLHLYLQTKEAKWQTEVTSGHVAPTVTSPCTNTQKVATNVNVKLKKYKQMAETSGVQICISHYTNTQKGHNKYEFENEEIGINGLQTCI